MFYAGDVVLEEIWEGAMGGLVGRKGSGKNQNFDMDFAPACRNSLNLCKQIRKYPSGNLIRRRKIQVFNYSDIPEVLALAGFILASLSSFRPTPTELKALS